MPELADLAFRWLQVRSAPGDRQESELTFRLVQISLRESFVRQRQILSLAAAASWYQFARQATEAGKLHEVNILHVTALAQMLNESTKGRGF